MLTSNDTDRHLRGWLYRRGWEMMRCGAGIKVCVNEDMRAGWKASKQADRLLRKLGVRRAKTHG